MHTFKICDECGVKDLSDNLQLFPLQKKKTGMRTSDSLSVPFCWKNLIYILYRSALGLQTTCNCKHTFYEPVREKINNFGFRPGQTQTGLYNHDA